jgi:rod shape determining protein RodA
LAFSYFFSFLFVDYRFLFEKYFTYSILALSFLILILVLFTPGHPKSWFNIFGFAFQPSEFSKIGFFILLAIFLSHYQLDLINPIYLISSSITLLPYLFLILLQPDWGMAFLYFLVWLLVVISFLSKKEIIYGSLILILIFSFFMAFCFKRLSKRKDFNIF